MSAQLLLGLAVGTLLLLIGGYALHLWRKLVALEARMEDEPPAGDEHR